MANEFERQSLCLQSVTADSSIDCSLDYGRRRLIKAVIRMTVKTKIGRLYENLNYLGVIPV